MRALRGLLIGTAQVVFLGALGSGLWHLFDEHLYDPLSRVLLTLVTFGLNSLRKSIYAEVAHGHHEHTSILILGFLIAGMMTLPSYLMARIWLFRRPPPHTEGTYEHLRSRLLRNAVITSTIAIVPGIIVFTQFLMLDYTNRAITHFEHSLTICAPYLTSEEERAIRSQFALIKTSADYEAVIQRLQAVATQHQVNLRDFSIW